MPAGVWAVTWSKIGYGDVLVPVELGKTNLVKEPAQPVEPADPFELLMETTAVHIYLAEARFTYDPGKAGVAASPEIPGTVGNPGNPNAEPPIPPTPATETIPAVAAVAEACA